MSTQIVTPTEREKAAPESATPAAPSAVGESARQLDRDRHFETAHLMDDLKGRSVRGGAVTLAAQGVTFALRMVQTVILARLLAPEAFGLVAMVMAVTGFVAMFKNAGLSMATVQREHITHEQVSTLFWINVGLSCVMALVVAVLAPAISWLYGEPRLTAITLVLAGTFVLTGFSIQHGALLRRQMRFTAIATMQIITMTASAIVGITAALLGAGYWALVWVMVTGSVMSPLLVWSVCRWVPGLPVRGCGVREMLAFGGNLTGFNFVNYFARQADDILIGWAWGAMTLGFYTKAYALLLFPIQQLNTPLSSVAVPMLSRLQGDPERYRQTYLHVIQTVAIVTAPLAALLVFTADWVVLLVLGPEWTKAATIFAWLGLAVFYQPISNSTGWLFVTQGRTNDMMRWGLAGGSLSLLSFLIGIPWGAVGIAAAYSISGLVVRAPLLFWWVGRRGPIATGDLYRTLALPSMLLLAVAATTLTIRASDVTHGIAVWYALTITGTLAGTVVACVLLSLKSGRKILKNTATLIMEFSR